MPSLMQYWVHWQKVTSAFIFRQATRNGAVQVRTVSLPLRLNAFEHAVEETILDRPAWLVPAEEMIWSKASIMERDRFDGADIAHVLRAHGPELDWGRLLARFGGHWRVLLAHLVLFGFIYPSERERIPGAVLEELLERLRRERATPPADDRLCRGTLLSILQYRTDIEEWGYRDARLPPEGTMSPEEVARWMAAFTVNGPL